jgi:tRNA/rRNA methyltransferase
MTDSIGPGGSAEGAPWDGALDRVRFVLVEPSHTGNIGSSARALRSMGFKRLVLVQPRDPAFRNAPDAVALAAGAADVLAASIACTSLAEALEGVQLAFATTGYGREHGPQVLEVREAARRGAGLVLEAGAQVAFVFGPERTGLSNDDVRRCHYACSIPADPQRASLNLAQAVQVVAYEARREALALAGAVDRPPPRRDAGQPAPRAEELPAGVEQTEALYAHLEQGLAALGVLDPAQPRHLMARLRKLFARARPTPTEVDILRGVAAAMVQPRRERAGSKKKG